MSDDSVRVRGRPGTRAASVTGVCDALGMHDPPSEIAHAEIAQPEIAQPEIAQRAYELLAALAGPDAVLRDDQLTAISALVAQRRRVLVVQRTGWGKSAVYWIATKLLRDDGRGPTLVVSPLLALMRDQVDAAERMGLAARTVNSTNIDDWAPIFDELAAGEVDVLLISPERLNNQTFRDSVLPRLAGSIGFLVIDEAHCVSDWGHDFRPDYRRIASVIEGLDDDVAILATTATANERVTADVATQIGEDTLTLRGSLDRESLALSVVRLESGAERLAWLLTELEAAAGSGIVYCLTVAEVERVAEFLVAEGVAAAAYTGSTPPPDRERIEADLKANRLTAVVATSALGMGYDKGDLAFVIHLGAPSSPIAYYQQVGRAGRAIDSARAVLLPSPEDRAIWNYFDSTAFPREEVVRQVLDAIEAEGPIKMTQLESAVNLRRGRLEALLKVLDVEGAVERRGTAWVRTAQPWQYDAERLAGVAAARKAEQRSIIDYIESDACRMRLLREALDDPWAQDCDRCDNCTGVSSDHDLDADRVAAALAHLRSAEFVIEPRKQWPRGFDLRKGNIKDHLRAQPGRALAFGTDPGWSSSVSAAVEGSDAAVPEELIAGVVRVLNRWKWQRPTWVCPVPSRSHPLLVSSLAARIAELGKMELVDCLERAEGLPAQRAMQNSVRQAGNVVDTFTVSGAVPGGPVLVVDDTSQSGWTLTAVAEVLLEAGSGPVQPLVLWRRP